MTKATPLGKPTIVGLDPFFHMVPGGEFNACIGKQGAEENYIDGYMEAAQELASAVIDKRQFGKRDTLAMPILYNARHALELTLKFAIDQLTQLDRAIAPIKANHDIETQWGALRAGVVGDEAIRELVLRLEPFVASLAAIDEDGQELRYATNRDGERSLETYSLVDLELVKASLDELGTLLSDLKYRVESLREEKSSGTWTNECSRSDLIEIARMLPPRSAWGTDAFSGAKEAVMERFGLGSRKFSEAVDRIEASRQGRLLLGLETPLAHLTDEHALLAVELWRHRHPQQETGPDSSIVVHSARTLRERLIDRQHRSGEVSAGLDRLLTELGAEEIADLEAIFYIGRQRWLPEFYEETLERTKAEHAVEPNLKMKLNHIMEKRNFALEIVNGLKLLGQPTLAAKIEAYLSSDRSTQEAV